MLSIGMLIPYATLRVLIAGVFILQSRPVLTGFMAAQIAIAYFYDILNPVGVLSLGAFWGMCEFHWRKLSSSEVLNSFRLFLIVALALGFANHLIPGFQNLRVLDAVTLSSTSIPLTFYLNFDKTMAAVILAVTSALLFKQSGSWAKKTISETLKITVLCLALLIPLAILSGYIQLDPKFPESFWLWAFNNLLFVCFAEEVIFRGIIQNYLMQVAKRWQISPFIPIVVTSLLFGVLLLGHLHGGLVYMTFAIIAGLFYGYAYHATGRLEAAILVHFMVNLCHFLFFSYPALAR